MKELGLSFDSNFIKSLSILGWVRGDREEFYSEHCAKVSEASRIQLKLIKWQHLSASPGSNFFGDYGKPVFGRTDTEPCGH